MLWRRQAQTTGAEKEPLRILGMVRIAIRNCPLYNRGANKNQNIHFQNKSKMPCSTQTHGLDPRKSRPLSASDSTRKPRRISSEFSITSSSHSLPPEAESREAYYAVPQSAKFTNRRSSPDDVKKRWRSKQTAAKQRHLSPERPVSWLAWMYAMTSKALQTAGANKPSVEDEKATPRARRNGQSRRVARASF